MAEREIDAFSASTFNQDIGVIVDRCSDTFGIERRGVEIITKPMMKSTLSPPAVISLLCGVFFVIGYCNSAAGSQEQAVDSPTATQQVVAEPEPMTLEQQLLQLQQTLSDKEQEKKALERRLRKEKDEVTKEQLAQELTATEDIIAGMREEIVNFATGGAKVFQEAAVVKADFDWREDVELLFQPLIDQLRAITERPRLIEKTESEIVYWQKRQRELQEAATNLDNNIATIKNAALKKEVQALRDTTASRLNSAQQKLALLKNELQALKIDDDSIWETLEDIFINVILEFFLHFFLAVLAAFLAYYAVNVVSIIIIATLPKNKKSGHKFAQHAVVFGRFVLTSIAVIVTYFTVLYSFSEWLLLLISLLIIASLALGLRETLPNYLIEVKTLLNMGTIRQGERLIYHGLPWKISRLSVHTYLLNPALDGQLRVPLTEIVMLSSRPNQRHEPWFPTQVGDVILMDDEVCGRIARQTPDIVEVNRGGSIYTYTTQDFLSRRPCNLSQNGFTLYETFGIDYQHQAEVTTTVLDTYCQALEKAMQTSPFARYNTGVSIEFSMAAASSLDFRILASFSGEAAADYFRIKRFIQKASVDVANREGWVIPFQQLTVHHQPV